MSNQLQHSAETWGRMIEEAIAVGFYFTWGNELFIQAGLHEISVTIFSKH